MLMIRKILIAGVAALSWLSSACAQTTSKDLYEKFIETVNPKASAIGFSQTGQRYALTSLGESKISQKPIYYVAEIFVPKGDNTPTIRFERNQKCKPTSAKAPIETRIIKVSGQKIEAIYGCTSAGLSEIFLPLSAKGRSFVRKEFLEVAYVFVKFDGEIVPFNTDGYEVHDEEEAGEVL